MTLGERLTRLRSQAGLSQDALAERLGVSRQSVSKWENGVSTPDLDKLVKLGEVFGVSLDQLVKGEAPPPAEPEPRRTWRRLAALYRERGYLLGWALAAWGAWGLLRSVWSCLAALPVLGGQAALQLFFVGLLTAHVQNFAKILLGALLVLYGKRAAGRLRRHHLAWAPVAVGVFGIPRIAAVRTGLLPFLLTIAQAGPGMTDKSEWAQLLTGLLRESGGCLLLLVLGSAALLTGRPRR